MIQTLISDGRRILGNSMSGFQATVASIFYANFVNVDKSLDITSDTKEISHSQHRAGRQRHNV